MIEPKIKTKIIFSIVIGLLGSIFVAGFLLILLLSSVEAASPAPQPIRPSFRDELCEKLDGIQTELPCSSVGSFKNKTIASDYFALFEKKFKPNKTTYDEVFDLLGSEKIEEITPFYMYSDYHQFDLAGTGVNRIIIWNNYENIVDSFVFIRPDVLTPLSKETIIDLCNRLSLTNTPLCLSKAIVYAQDFFTPIEKKYSGKADTEALFASLMPYSYIENPHHYNLYFLFGDNINSRILFYFDKSKVLEDLVFVQDFTSIPINTRILADLCAKLDIKQDTKKCEPNTQTFTSDLEEEIRAAFPVGIATYEDVQVVFGKFQFRFDYPVRDANGDAVTKSFYDLTGNDYTVLMFYFDTNFIVTEIRFTCGSGCSRD
ncbi:MAG: hypothetical protein H7Y59_13260 [Anaerolineales bacterium]|nr:hypothetical protein [Anaerolineales bacterium]